MKGFKIFLLILLGIVLGAGGAIGFYFLTFGQIAWQQYLEEKLLPNAVLIISAVGTLCAASLPVINKVQLSLAKFDKATSDINSTVEVGKRTDDALYAQDQKLADFKKELDEIRETAESTKEMIHIGLCNTTELVKNGFSAAIAKAGGYEVDKIKVGIENERKDEEA